MDNLIVAYGIDGEGYKFRCGVKKTGARNKVIVRPPFTKPFLEAFRHDRVKETLPRFEGAKDGQWCWFEERA